MSKEIKGYIKMQLKAGNATPGAPIAPILGSKGLSQHMMNFCKEFNERTKSKAGQILPVVITYYDDKSISFVVKCEPVAVTLLKAVKKEKGSGVPNRTKIGSLPYSKIEEIAKEKMEDLNAYDVENAAKIIMGTARSLGIDIVK